jgi:hypothetical protein
MRYLLPVRAELQGWVEMSDDRSKCPQCGGMLFFTLGIYQFVRWRCLNDCGYTRDERVPEVITEEDLVKRWEFMKEGCSDSNYHDHYEHFTKCAVCGHYAGQHKFMERYSPNYITPYDNTRFGKCLAPGCSCQECK